MQEVYQTFRELGNNLPKTNPRDQILLIRGDQRKKELPSSQMKKKNKKNAPLFSNGKFHNQSVINFRRYLHGGEPASQTERPTSIKKKETPGPQSWQMLQNRMKSEVVLKRAFSEVRVRDEINLSGNTQHCVQHGVQ